MRFARFLQVSVERRGALADIDHLRGQPLGDSAGGFQRPGGRRFDFGELAGHGIADDLFQRFPGGFGQLSGACGNDGGLIDSRARSAACAAASLTCRSAATSAGPVSPKAVRPRHPRCGPHRRARQDAFGPADPGVDRGQQGREPIMLRLDCTGAAFQPAAGLDGSRWAHSISGRADCATASMRSAPAWASPISPDSCSTDWRSAAVRSARPTMAPSCTPDCCDNASSSPRMRLRALMMETARCIAIRRQLSKPLVQRGNANADVGDHALRHAFLLAQSAR